MSLIDDLFGCLLGMIPYYYWVKLGFFVFLFAPQTRGAQLLYKTVVKDLLDRYKDKIEGLISDVKGSVSDVAKEAKKAAIDEMQKPEHFMKAAQVAAQAQKELEKIEKQE